jgi:hypothetical protein
MQYGTSDISTESEHQMQGNDLSIFSQTQYAVADIYYGFGIICHVLLGGQYPNTGECLET